MRDVSIIFDVDWAPDAALRFTSDILKEHGVKSTWFLTHNSDEIKQLTTGDDLIEFGIHPNFLPDSTHGNNQEQILENTIKLIPETRLIRTHAYYFSSLLFKLIAEKTNINIDLSIFQPHVQNIQAFNHFSSGRYIKRIPVFWEDDYEMKLPGQNWETNFDEISLPGLKVFAFHPIHILLNSISMEKYEACLQHKKNFQSLTYDQLQPYINNKHFGARNFLIELISKNNDDLQFNYVSDIQ